MIGLLVLLVCIEFSYDFLPAGEEVIGDFVNFGSSCMVFGKVQIWNVDRVPFVVVNDDLGHYFGLDTALMISIHSASERSP